MDLPEWLALPPGERYAAVTREAAKVRSRRAVSASAAAVGLARALAEIPWPGRAVAGVMWSVRGELRCRETFADPHPLDFPGTTETLPVPLDKISQVR
jgi:hypothetical protein